MNTCAIFPSERSTVFHNIFTESSATLPTYSMGGNTKKSMLHISPKAANNRCKRQMKARDLKLRLSANAMLTFDTSATILTPCSPRPPAPSQRNTLPSDDSTNLACRDCNIHQKGSGSRQLSTGTRRGKEERGRKSR